LAFGLILSANFFINFLVNLNELVPLSSFWEQKFSMLHEQASETQAYFLNYSGMDQLILVFLVMAIIPALVEEIYFRGLLVGLLKDMKMGVFHVIFYVIVAFCHDAFSILPFSSLVIYGRAYWAICTIEPKIYGLSIFVHLLNNGLIVIFTATNKAKITSLDLEQDPPLYLSIIGLLLFAALIYYFHQRTQGLG
jgi:membrane protease YdiL (CAAX protease family)